MPMQIRIEDIVAFTLVADLKSFVRAAEELNITQPALSRRIRKLEESIGARLLERTSRVVDLTIVGEEFLPAAKRMVRDFDRSLSDIVDVIQKRSGVVSVAFNMTVATTAMPEILDRFHQLHPNLEVRVFEDSSPPILERVHQGEVEFGVVNTYSLQPDHIFEPLIEDRFVALCHRDHPIARKRRVTWKDLYDYPYIEMSPRSGTQRLLERTLADTGLLPNGIFQVAHTLSLLGIVGKNLAVSAVPYLASLQRPDLNIIGRPLTNPTVRRTVGLVKMRGRTLSPAAEALEAVTREVIGEMAKRMAQVQ